MKRKVYKAARKEAKRFKKQGWYVAPGALPMDKQVEKSWERQYEDDEKGYPLYLVATGNSVAETQSAAKLQALELAKLELAGIVQTNIIAIIENSVANNQLSREDAASVTKTVRRRPFWNISRKRRQSREHPSSMTKTCRCSTALLSR